MGRINFTNLYLSLDFHSYESLEAAKKAGAPLLMYGNFIQTIVDFTIVGFAIFMLVKAVNKAQELALKKEAANQVAVAPTTKECHACASDIKIKAKLCPYCRAEQA
jgi:large conductance mechanosensitive channel